MTGHENTGRWNLQQTAAQLGAAAKIFLLLSIVYVTGLVALKAFAIGYFPRFTQIEVLSDILWLTLVGGSALLVAAFAPWLAGLFLAAIATNSNWPQRSQGPHSSKRRLDLFTDFELKLIAVLGIVVPVFLATIMRESESAVTVLGAFINASALIAFVLLGKPPHVDESLRVDPPVHLDGSLINTSGHGAITGVLRNRGRIALRILVGVRILKLLVIAAPCAFLVYFLYGRLGYEIFLKDRESVWGPITLFMLAMTNVDVCQRAVRSNFQSHRGGWLLCLLVTCAIIGEMSDDLLRGARVGAMRDAEVIFDPKFDALMHRVSAETRVEGAVGVARVDVLLAFGSDVVLATSLTDSSTAARCTFGPNIPAPIARSASAGVLKGNAVAGSGHRACVVLPRAAVYAIM
jgi:hypothetical protein